jgi:predicted nucleic acid-binding protein
MGRVRELGAKVYLDTNIVIYAIEGFADLAVQDSSFVASLGRCTNCRRHQRTHLSRSLNQTTERSKSAGARSLSEIPDPTSALQVVPISREILEEAARLRAMTKLKLPDAIHLATATLNGCDCFLTNDDSFKSITTANIKILSEINLV